MLLIDGSGQTDGDGGWVGVVHTCLMVGGGGRRQDEQTDDKQQHK